MHIIFLTRKMKSFIWEKYKSARQLTKFNKMVFPVKSSTSIRLLDIIANTPVKKRIPKVIYTHYIMLLELQSCIPNKTIPLSLGLKTQLFDLWSQKQRKYKNKATINHSFNWLVNVIMFIRQRFWHYISPIARFGMSKNFAFNLNINFITQAV